MKPIETIEKEVNGMIGTSESSKYTTVLVIGELFEENILESEEDKVKARVSFVNKKTKHLIGAIYLKGVENKDKLQIAVDGYSEKINEILPCL